MSRAKGPCAKQAPRSLADLRPAARAVLRKVQTHAGMDDAGALEWLDRVAPVWGTTLANAGAWVQGAAPTTGGPGRDARSNQILTKHEARIIACWSTRPWEVMTRPAWERWQSEGWSFGAGVEFVPLPEIGALVAALTVDWPLLWWPAGAAPDVARDVGVVRLDEGRLSEYLLRRNAAGESYLTGAALFADGCLRILRDGFGDWYQAQCRRAAPDPGSQMRMELALNGGAARR